MAKRLSIITKQGVAARAPRTYAEKLISEGKAHYTSKSKYKALIKKQAKIAKRQARVGL